MKQEKFIISDLEKQLKEKPRTPEESLERMKQELDEKSKEIGKQFDDGEIDKQEFKKKILSLIDRVTNPGNE